jgi:HK97 family phage portal protein
VKFLSNIFGGASKGGSEAPAAELPAVAKSTPQHWEWQDLMGSGENSGGAANLTRPYAQSVWVSSAIGFVAQPIQAVPLVFSRDRRGGDVVIEDAALTAFWERPAKSRGGLMARADLIEATVAWLCLKGEAFWLMDDSFLKRGMKKSPLILARPDDMRPVLEGDEQKVVGWVWTGGRGRREVLVPQQVVHLKFYNPYDEVRGLPKWEAAKIAADSDYAAGVFARNLMANNGDRGPYVIGKDGGASDDQVKQITAMLRQKRELSRRGDFRPVFLTGDIEVKEPGLSAVDTAYIAQRVENRHEIYAAFGVPMSFAEVMSSYSIGSASDRFRLIEDTCQPMGSKIADGIEQVCNEMLGFPVFAEWDWDEHSTMQAVRAERVESAAKLVDRGMPWKDASEYLRLKLPRFKGDDVGRVPFNLTEIGGEEDSRDQKPETSEEPDPVEELEKVLRSGFSAPPLRQGSEGQAVKACGNGCGCGAHEKADGKPNKVWERTHAKRRPWEKMMAKKIRRLLMDARSETLRKLADVLATEDATKAVETRLNILAILFDLGEWLPRWVKALAEVDRNALMAAGLELWTDELGKDDPLVMPAVQVNTAIRLRENRLSNAGTKVWDRVRKDLETAIADGTPNEELAGKIKQSFHGIDSTRAMAIAQTETTVVYETARDMVFREAGVQWTQWLHSGLLDHARLTHQAAHEQIREMGEPFDIGGITLRFPGDPEAPADEVINCRCVRIAVAGPDQEDIEGNEGDFPY